MLYSLIRPWLFKLEAETAHRLSLTALTLLNQTGLLRLVAQPGPARPRQLMGLTFPNPVGLAAGLDKNGDYIAALGGLGFGFLEVGTITPRPQPGNPRPRLFRLPAGQAVINRMGFNNKGVAYLAQRLRQTTYPGIIGVNIGKNFGTPLAEAHRDYLLCMQQLYALASFITVNISSPNTKGLRDLQNVSDLTRLLHILKTEQHHLAAEHQKYVPLVVKIAPDLTTDQIKALADRFMTHKVDGVIATNTTISRSAVDHLPHGRQAGGLSGAPLTARSTEVIRLLRQQMGPAMPLIGVGGIMTAEDAQAKIEAGADVVQLYTGLVYQGPPLVGQVVRRLAA